MYVKDYYTTLQLPPGASLQQVKQAYRKLAMQYHPDKHGGDKYSEAYFHEIQEAYDVLSHPQRRDMYHQQRWYQQSTGKKFTESTPQTPHKFLQQCIGLHEFVKGLDIFRMDKPALQRYIEVLLSAENIAMLHSFNDAHTGNKIFDLLLSCTTPLSHQQLLAITPKMQMLLLQKDPGREHAWQAQLKAAKHQKRWDAYKLWLIVTATLLICLLIFWLGN